MDLRQRQDGVAEQSWVIKLRREPILDFINQYNWSPDDINYHKTIKMPSKPAYPTCRLG